MLQTELAAVEVNLRSDFGHLIFRTFCENLKNWGFGGEKKKITKNFLSM